MVSTPELPALHILYRDRRLVAVHKPAGLLVHRSAIDRHETRFLLQDLRDQIGQRVYPVHRLDKPTAGVMVFGLDAEVARTIGAAFTAGQVRKSYLAVVRGYLEGEGCIDYPLAERPDRMTDRRARRDKPPQPAVTNYRCLAQVELPYAVRPYPSARYSLLRVEPRTGRKHQIRRHMKHVFHPVVGDTTHGDGHHNRLFRERLDCGRLLLTAVQLELAHPVSGDPLCLRAPPDAGFLRVLRELGWSRVWREQSA